MPIVLIKYKGINAQVFLVGQPPVILTGSELIVLESKYGISSCNRRGMKQIQNSGLEFWSRMKLKMKVLVNQLTRTQAQWTRA